MEVNGQFHTPDALLPGKSPRYPLDGRLGWPQNRSGHCGTDKNLLHLLETNPGRPVLTLPLYRLGYRGSQMLSLRKLQIRNNIHVLNNARGWTKEAFHLSRKCNAQWAEGIRQAVPAWHIYCTKVYNRMSLTVRLVQRGVMRVTYVDAPSRDDRCRLSDVRKEWG
jgi:hypothetical protein